MILNILGIWNEYFTFYMYAPSKVTLALGLNGLVEANKYGKVSYPELFAVMLFSVVPSVLLCTFAQKLIVNNVSIGGLKGALRGGLKFYTINAESRSIRRLTAKFFRLRALRAATKSSFRTAVKRAERNASWKRNAVKAVSLFSLMLLTKKCPFIIPKRALS